MKTKIYIKTFIAGFAMLMLVLQVNAQLPGCIPALLGNPNIGAGVTTELYTTDLGQTGYFWTVTSAGSIISGQGTEAVTIQWNSPTTNQTVTVTYTGACQPASYIVIYYPFPKAINAATIPQFVDPMPHFAAGLRVNAKAGGHLVVTDNLVRQVALSTGTVTTTGTIGDPATPHAGEGNYAGYAVSTDGGAHFGPAMWPAQTIEAQQGNQLVVEYRNLLYGVKYSDFNILADQVLMMNGYTLNGNPQTDPYMGDIPMSVHLHGGEMPSNSDGGPLAWFTPGYAQQGPGFAYEASSVCTYPNKQEGTTLWYHPHDQGLTRINVYTGLAGYYFLRGANEDALHLPGWSGDGLVREVTPPGKTQTFNGSNTYKPEVELAIQDRMFNEKGELYWPVTPTNPDVNPYWTPEFFGDVMTVNGKSWPYLSVAPRKYMFRMLDGCNARFLNLWLTTDPTTGAKDGPPITVLSTEGGFLQAPVVIDPRNATGNTLFLAPAERPMVVIDFTGYPTGTVFTLMNDAAAPYPTGDPVIPGLTDRIMQFVVNGEVVTPDNSVVPADLRPASPMVKLTDFAGSLIATPTLKRQILLNEITGVGGPLRVAVNNSHFDALTPTPGEPVSFGGPTETPKEGTTEVWQIINTTADAHPMHPHLVQWQLVSRQAFDVVGYMNAYSSAWASRATPIPNYPSFATYPGGAGSPYPYNNLNSDNAVGGNPSVTPFLQGAVIPALPEEMGWKDAVKSLPGQVETYIVRFAPTEKPLNAPPMDMVFPFDPSKGPGYVYHCHIIDHEDMDMMRPLLVQPADVRFPNITVQPVNYTGCSGWTGSFSVTATSINTISYKWQCSTNGGVSWNDLAGASPYTNVLTPTLTIDPLPMLFNGYQYRCVLSTENGSVTSNPVTLTVLQSPVPVLNGPATVCPYSVNVYTTDPGKTGYAWSVPTGGTITAGGTAADNTITIKWTVPGPQTVLVNYTAANGCSARTPTTFNVSVYPLVVPTISGPSEVCFGTKSNVYTTEPGMTNYQWTVSQGGMILAGGTPTSSSITIRWKTAGARSVSVNYTNANGCTAPAPTVANVTVDPLPMPYITGPIIVKVGATITYNTQSGMTNYVWSTLGSGITFQSGQGTSTLNVVCTSPGIKILLVTYTTPFGCEPLIQGIYFVMANKTKDLEISGTPVDSTGILSSETASSLKFDVYPVPNDGHFTASINSPTEDVYSIQVYNAYGVKVYELGDIYVNGLATRNIDIRPAPSGVYTVVFTNNQSQTVRKILIRR